MRVLLINANRFKQPWPVIPIGLIYMASVLEKDRKDTVHILDLCFSKNCPKEIENTVDFFRPNVYKKY